MIFAILNTIFILLTLIFNIFIFLIKVAFKVIKFILFHSLLRMLVLLIIFKYALNLSLQLTSSLYFLFVMYKAAIFFKITTKIKENIKISLSNLKNNKKVQHNLKKLKNNYILLKNLCLENDDDCFKIENLLICSKGIFNIKNLGLPINNSNDDIVISTDNIDQISYELTKSNDLLEDILPTEVPIINVITLSNDNLVIENSSQLTSSVICIKNLSSFIENNFKDIANLDNTYLKNIIIENNRWKLDCFISAFLNFLWQNKSILLFFFAFSILYYFYSILILTLL